MFGPVLDSFRHVKVVYRNRIASQEARIQTSNRIDGNLGNGIVANSVCYPCAPDLVKFAKRI